MFRYSASIRAILRCVLDGVTDSLRLPSTLIFFLSSVTVRVRAAQCLVLNGGIFLGSILLADFVLAPLLRLLLSMSAASGMPLAGSSIALPSAEGGLAEWANVAFLYAYQLLWIYPLYAISFILNAIWYQDIADHAFITHGSATPARALTFQKWVATMSDEVYRLLLVTGYTLQLTLASFVPVVGPALTVMHLCWMYSLYSFEYKWSLLGWSLEYRLRYFERHWAYFLGFGLPAVILSLVFPKFLSLGIFALTFPIFIILAIIAKPTTHVPKSARRGSKDETGVAKAKDAGARGKAADKAPADLSAAAVLCPQLPIFRIATWINWRLLSQLQSRASKMTRRPSLEPGGPTKLASPTNAQE